MKKILEKEGMSMCGKRLSLFGFVILFLMFWSGLPFGQDGVPVFEVYGTMYVGHSGIPESEAYTIIVANLTRNQSIETNLSTGINLGKYCAVFVDYSGNAAARMGDTFEIKARRISNGVIYASARHIISIEELRDMQVRVDLFENEVQSRGSSWGAIKSLF